GQVGEGRGLARPGQAAREVERVELLELLLDPVGDLKNGVVDAGAGPLGLNDHRLNRERRVFLATQADVRHHAGAHRRQHEGPDERFVPQCPVVQVELAHCRRSSGILTNWPGTRLLTPATTTLMPCVSPSATCTTSSWRAAMAISRS